MSKNVLSGRHKLWARNFRNQHLVSATETSYSVLSWYYIWWYLIITQRTTLSVVNIVVNERSDPVAQLNTTCECQGFTNFLHWLNHMVRNVCRLHHVTGKLFSQCDHVIQRSVVACVWSHKFVIRMAVVAYPLLLLNVVSLHCDSSSTEFVAGKS
jgi:hypothetical protein